ncbi:hypothetical protein UO65_6420 [Actinokineospora spheciospongiae]|uniref:Uncharacterized protein n=1 Tax=Actinokineospora spheciospongiae TaxID=909613 RepID=W7ICP1_9PSEU|nr:hypothetical protein UO65_6420 [Actinokineospora spheciospongiae]
MGRPGLTRTTGPGTSTPGRPPRSPPPPAATPARPAPGADRRPRRAPPRWAIRSKWERRRGKMGSRPLAGQAWRPTRRTGSPRD